MDVIDNSISILDANDFISNVASTTTKEIIANQIIYNFGETDPNVARENADPCSSYHAGRRSC